MTQNDLSFEQAFQRLTEVVARLESGDGSLTERTELFEEGIHLSRTCSNLLDAIEKKVEMLLEHDDGSEEIVSLESDDEEEEE